VILAARGVYAVVPPGRQTEDFRPDPFLVAAAVRPDGVFSHHSALELLCVAHSVWNQCTLYAAERRRPLRLDEITVRFLDHPGPLRKGSGIHLGTRKIEKQGKLLLITGPERTLIEGFRRPALAGGLEELVTSAGGFGVLDLGLIDEVLQEKVIRLGEFAADLFHHPFLGNVLTLKGGTVLNLCFGPPKRLSVDLDFIYVGHPEREIMLKERPKIE
jgi:hypothetical protein